MSLRSERLPVPPGRLGRSILRSDSDEGDPEPAEDLDEDPDADELVAL
jgi:hypothetical protein